MAHHHSVSGCLARFVSRMRDLVPDAICAARIERFLEKCDRGNTAPLPDALGDRNVRIEKAIAQMEPLTRGILILVVGRKMSVSDVARHFRMSEDRVRRHFRLASELVVKHAEDEAR